MAKVVCQNEDVEDLYSLDEKKIIVYVEDKKLHLKVHTHFYTLIKEGFCKLCLL